MSDSQGTDLNRVLEEWEVIVEEDWDSSDGESECGKALLETVIWNKIPQADKKSIPESCNVSTPAHTGSKSTNPYATLPAPEIAHNVLQGMFSTFRISELDTILDGLSSRRTSYIGMSRDMLMEKLRKGIDERQQAMGIPLLEELIGEGHVGP